MAGGGARAGAGRPVGGMSQSRRLIIQGLQRGFEKAGRARGLMGEGEEVVIESIAQVAADLILGGNGRDALALLVGAAPKDGDGEREKSPLVRALERLPGMVSGPERSQTEPGERADAVIPEVYDGGATHPQSVALPHQPFFAPQARLLPPDLDAPTLVRGPDARAAERPGHPPPPGSPTPSIYPGCQRKF